MAVTVQDLLDVQRLSLRLLTGRDAISRPIRWVHASELDDPTPWLKGGELLLTTGMGLGATPAKQRAYVRRLAEAGVAGVGLGLGFSHEHAPRAMVAAAETAGLPLFEVPYPVPFIAITEAIFTRIVAEQYDTLQRATDAEHALTRAVLQGSGVEGIAGSLADALKGWALVLDLHGQAMAATSTSASNRAGRLWRELVDSRPDGTSFSLSLVDGGDHVSMQPVGAHGRIEAFLAVGTKEQPSQFDRIVAGHALSLIAIELAKSRAVEEAQRKLQGDFFDELVAGTMSPVDAGRGLARFGFDRTAMVTAVALEGPDPDALAQAATDDRSRSGGAFLVSARDDEVHLVLPAVPEVDLGALTDSLGPRVGAPVRAGSGSPVAPHDVGRSLREARYALQVCRLEGWPYAGFERLGTYRLLLSMTDPDALRAFAESLLAPLDAYDQDHRGELVDSLQAFLQHNARWETAAADLYVHRHTLRYRMRKVEELTGRDLSNSFDRMEFWLALRARDLLSAQIDA